MDNASKTFVNIYGHPQRGKVTVVTGARGVGKSTFVYQWTKDLNTLYASSELTKEACLDYFARFGSASKKFSSDVEGYDVGRLLEVTKAIDPDVLVVDTVNLCYDENVKGDIGSPTQTRSVMSQLKTFAEASNIAVVVIAHTTKDGEIAVPSAFEDVQTLIRIVRNDEEKRSIYVESRIDGKFDEKGFSF